ncbi:MAG: histidine kinase [Bacteroidales bacterium]|nr:histidine kinase [Bacteroidales bacterium]
MDVSVALSGQNLNDLRIENITSEYIRIEQGLSQNTVNSILQDKEGYLWIGTWSGLNRFDGYHFKVITRKAYEPDKGLSNPTITGLAEDTLGHIWAATRKGLNRIQKNNLSVTQFLLDNSGSLGMKCDSLTTLFTDSRGKIWIGTKHCAMILDPGSLHFRSLEHNPRDFTTLSSNLIQCFAEDTDGNIWIGTEFGLNKLILTSGRVIRYLEDKYITKLQSDGEGGMWIGTLHGLIYYNPVTRRFTKIHSTDHFNITAVFYHKNLCWIGTRQHGVSIYNPKTRKLTSLNKVIPGSDFFSYNSFLSITADHLGFIWMGTSHKGLVKVILNPNTFTTIVNGYAVYGIAEAQPDQIWMGTQEGVLVHNLRSGSNYFIRHQPDIENSLSSNLITNLVKDDKWMWILTRNGLNRYNIKTGENQILLPDSSGNSIANNLVWDVLKDSRGIYWFATSNGLSEFNPVTNRFTNYFHNPNNPNSLSNNFCLDLLEEQPGVILVCTEHGFNRYTISTGQWENFLPIRGNLTSISDEYTLGAFKDSHGEFWISTNGGGYAKFDPETGTFINYTKTEGLADNIVYLSLEDQDGFLWCPTNHGLSRFDPVQEKFTNFFVQDGLLSNEFNIHSAFLRQNGEILLGGVNGVIGFFPTNTIRTGNPPIIQITGINTYTKGVSSELPVSKSIELLWDQNTFSISFSAMDFKNPFQNYYQFKLDNYDRDWNKLPKGVHTAEYRKVPPGLYHFIVKGTNSLGVSSPETITEIIIQPAWYQTLGFKITVPLFSILLITLMIIGRMAHIRRQHKIEKQLLTTKNELINSQKFALRSQMNPHFIFNSLNSIQNFILKNDSESANHYLSHFSSLMRKVLDYSQYNYITLTEELELTQLYLRLEKLRFTKKFDFTLQVDPAIDQHAVKIPPMLLQPFLENAILHGLQLINYMGILTVSVKDHNQYMSITIEDNGIGREKANHIRQRTGHRSKGLLNIEKRVQLYNKLNEQPIKVHIEDLKDQSGAPAGTCVIISVPYDIEDI